MEKESRFFSLGVVVLVGVLLVASLAGCGGGSAPDVDWELVISGSGTYVTILQEG